MSEQLCPCGQPLHYGSDTARHIVENYIAKVGATVAISTPEGTWRVPRHYVALHGIKADDLPELAALLGFERVEP